MRILLTGGAGFIGSHLADGFVAEGDQVTVVDDLSTGRIENLPAGAEFFQLGIQDDAVGDLVRRVRPDVLCHQAAQMNIRRSVDDPIDDARTNILGTIRLLEWCRTWGTRRILFASSGGAIYGEQESFPAAEAHPTCPISPYGAAKLSAEAYLHYYAVVYGFQVTSLRYANVYGLRQNPHGEAGVVAIFIERLLQGLPLTINGDGTQTRDFVAVEDVVRANLLALSHGLQGAYNVGTGVETSVNRLAELLVAILDRPVPVRHGPPKAGEQKRSVLDSARLWRDTGWCPAIALEDGLRRLATPQYTRTG